MLFHPAAFIVVFSVNNGDQIVTGNYLGNSVQKSVYAGNMNAMVDKGRDSEIWEFPVVNKGTVYYHL